MDNYRVLEEAVDMADNFEDKFKINVPMGVGDDEAGDNDENDAESDWTIDDVDKSSHTMLVFAKEILPRAYKMTAFPMNSSASSQSCSPLTRLPEEVLVLVIKAIPPLTRCAFALTCKRFATISRDNKCLQLVYAERHELGQFGFLFDPRSIYHASSMGYQWHPDQNLDAKNEIERMGGVCTWGITAAIFQWWYSAVEKFQRVFSSMEEFELWLEELW